MQGSQFKYRRFIDQPAKSTYIRAALLFNDFSSCTVVLAVEK